MAENSRKNMKLSKKQGTKTVVPELPVINYKVATSVKLEVCIKIPIEFLLGQSTIAPNEIEEII